MEPVIIVDVVYDIVMIIFIIVITTMMISLRKYRKLKEELLKQEMELKELEKENKERTVEHSNKILELVRMVVGQIAVIKFRTFQDNHNLEKVTKSVVQSLIDDVARTSRNSLNTDVFSFEDTFFTKEFYENYIIEMSILLVKDMFEKYVDGYDET